ACSSDPQSSCCRSCGSEEDSPPEGCDELSRDASCLLGELDVTFDDPNVRCFDQRRRFGETYLFTVERYIRGLTSPTIVDGRGEAVPNPLYADGRTPDMVHVALLAGVPSPLVTTETGGAVQLLTPSELSALMVRDKLIGDDEQRDP